MKGTHKEPDANSLLSVDWSKTVRPNPLPVPGGAHRRIQTVAKGEFNTHAYFGLDPKNVIIFDQGTRVLRWTAKYSCTLGAGRETRSRTGELAFRAGNIANHFDTTAFLNRVQEFEEQSAFNIARKKIAHVDPETGQIVKPAKPNGMKLEMFVFDVFPFTEHFSVLEVARNEEFSPLKNALGTGSDDPDTSP
ncbi:UDP-N-acetylhexosamine pyrophosphorylase [Mycena kentingensis (nom. inval.)]|nr:UDP-N-acetylhexosamine pyrophosphorylase [Mycena kentingensis (nom. inval.)]